MTTGPSAITPAESTLPQFQLDIIAHMNALPDLKKHVAYFPDVFTSHQVIICQNQDLEAHWPGRKVLKHWTKGFVLDAVWDAGRAERKPDYNKKNIKQGKERGTGVNHVRTASSPSVRTNDTTSSGTALTETYNMSPATTVSPSVEEDHHVAVPNPNKSDKLELNPMVIITMDE
jgi:hypothetical protein